MTNITENQDVIYLRSGSWNSLLDSDPVICTMEPFSDGMYYEAFGISLGVSFLLLFIGGVCIRKARKLISGFHRRDMSKMT